MAARPQVGLFDERRLARELAVADGFSCREQIRQQTERQALHLAEVLQQALPDRGAERA